MRITHLFAVLLAVAGIGAFTPASAATGAVKIAPATTIETGIPNADANQSRRRWTNSGYRIRYGNRGYGYRGGYRGYRGYRNPRYIAIPRVYSRSRYRGPRVACRTVWRYGRAYRSCYRR